MDTRAFPTKGNLIANKNSLSLAKQGYDLMDRKRNILISEIMSIVDEVSSIEGQISSTFKEAYEALEIANIQSGVETLLDMARSVEMDDSFKVYTRSVMGVEIPKVVSEGEESSLPVYSFYSTRESIDKAKEKFEKVKELSARLAELENAAFRLANGISKAQKRANALQNITIPKYESLVKSISSSLEEKEREEFIRLKVIKRNKQK